MGAYAGPNVIEDGLVFAIDAGNTKSYPGSGTTWSDLSGQGNNGTLTSGFPDLAALVAKTASGDGSLRVRSANSGSFISSPGPNDFHTSSSGIMINGSKVTTPVGRTMLQDYFVGAIGNASNLSTISHTFLGRVYKGRVYAVYLYNRQLTNDELSQNYNALRGRFGL